MRRTPWRKSPVCLPWIVLLAAGSLVGTNRCVAAVPHTPAAAIAYPTIQQVMLQRSYVAAGGVVHGSVRLELPPDVRPGAWLRIVAASAVDISADARPAGHRSEEILAAPLAAGAREVPFELRADGLLFGSIQIRAEVCLDKNAAAVATAWSAPVRVGVRNRLDLAGDWSVKGLKLLEGEMPRRGKDWQPPVAPATIALPGSLPFDEGFRGWVTLKRSVTWSGAGPWQPRVVCIDGASDSAAVRVNGVPVGETAPVEDVAVLTHWLEFHCPFKGPENEQKRLLVIAGGSEYPVRLPLPRALPADGKAVIEMTLRATSGGLFGLAKPPYGVLNEMFLELLPAVYVKAVSFDADKPGPQRRFTFSLTLANESGRPFAGKIRTVYGSYRGSMPYTGACPQTAAGEQAVSLAAGESTVQVLREETPRFDTCRATFLLSDNGGKLLDAAQQDFQTMTVEIRDRRDLYLNNERFLFKAQGSWGEDANSRLQLRLKGGNGFRAHRSAPSWRVPGLASEAANIDDRYKDGLLTSAGGALLASCEKCIFWNPKDTSNVTKAVRSIVARLAQCPGLIQWEATNELHGEPEEARVAILEAFHRFDPYHRPVLATKGSGEWEAEAHDGRVAGVDIVGCQYLLSKEAADSVTAAVTQQPIMSTEVNWNDMNLYNEKRLFQVWLEKGLCGSLLFDYNGHALDQPVPMLAPADGDREGHWSMIRQSHRALYQDLVATAVRQSDGRVLLTIGNRMPYTLRSPLVTVKDFGQFKPRDFAPGDAMTILMPAAQSPPLRERVVIRAEYVTHGGLKCMLILSPAVAGENK